MMGDTPTGSRSVRIACRAARSAAGVALLFCIVMSTLLIAGFIQTKAHDPLNAPSLVRLREQFSKDSSNDELKRDIQALDLLARKAFFTGQKQVRIGGFLLTAGALVLLISLRTAAELRRQLPDPSSLPGPEAVLESVGLGRRGITAFGVVALAVAFVAGVLMHSNLEQEMMSVVASGREPGTDDPDRGGAGSAPTREPQFPSRDEILANWPNFRGPDGNGVAHVAEAAQEWDGDSSQGIAWKSEIRKQGFSSPVVWGDKIFLTGGDDESREIYCLSVEDGRLLWAEQVGSVQGAPRETPEVNDNTGWAAPTPATDGRYVAAIFATGNIVCMDTSGKRLWSKAMGSPENHYAHSSSLLIRENTLYAQFDDSDRPRLAALMITTGEIMWSVDRKVISWASPICVKVGETWQLILADSASVSGYDPESGKRLWSEDCLGGEVAPSPAYADGMVFVANDQAVAAGISVKSASTEVSASVEWEYEDYLPDTASPLATDKYVLLATSDGALVCLEGKTGEVSWEQEFDNGFYASPILVGDLVYAVDLEGVTHVFRMESEYDPVADSPIGERTASTPAILGKGIFIRGNKHLFCIRK